MSSMWLGLVAGDLDPGPLGRTGQSTNRVSSSVEWQDQQSPANASQCVVFPVDQKAQGEGSVFS